MKKVTRLKGLRALFILGALASFCSGLGALGTAQPIPEVKPVLDISGIAEIQSIPVGDSELYIQGDDTPGYFSMEKILRSIANLAIMQMGLTDFVKIDPETGEVILEGEFGEVLKAILGFDPVIEFGLTVEHTDFIQTPGATPECDEDHYLLTINCRQIEVILYRDYGSPDKGLDWGIGGLLLRQNSETEFAPNGVPQVEEKELAINRDKITGKFYAYYTVRIIKYNDGKLLKWKQWKFVEGNPNPVWVGGSGS